MADEYVPDSEPVHYLTYDDRAACFASEPEWTGTTDPAAVNCEACRMTGAFGEERTRRAAGDPPPFVSQGGLRLDIDERGGFLVPRQLGGGGVGISK